MHTFSVLFFLLSISLFGQSLDFKLVHSTQPDYGVSYKKIVESSNPWSINVLEIDLTRSDLEIMAVTAFDSVAGNEQTSQMAKRMIQKGFEVIAAINADFYEDGGYSTNACISNGQMVSMPHKNFSVIVFDENNKPYIRKIKFEAKLSWAKNDYSINGVNTKRKKNELILYNRFYGRSTHTNKWGSEAILKTLNEKLVNDTIFCVVEQKQRFKGNAKIPENKIVISGHDRAAVFIDKALNVGDTVKVYIGYEGILVKIKDLVGGFTQLVTDGRNSAIESFDKVGTAQSRERFALFRHPRTAIGFNKDKSKLFMVTVDGRQQSSAGMTLPELADYMVSLGVYQALNFDGGGSTTMVVDGKVVNSPSDPTGERAVSNVLMIIKK